MLQMVKCDMIKIDDCIRVSTATMGRATTTVRGCTRVRVWSDEHTGLGRGRVRVSKMNTLDQDGVGRG